MKDFKDMMPEYRKHVSDVETRAQAFYGVDSLESVVARFHDSLEDGEKLSTNCPVPFAITTRC